MAPPWRRPSSDCDCNRFAAIPCEQHLGGGGCGFDLITHRVPFIVAELGLPSALVSR